MTAAATLRACSACGRTSEDDFQALSDTFGRELSEKLFFDKHLLSVYKQQLHHVEQVLGLLEDKVDESEAEESGHVLDELQITLLTKPSVIEFAKGIAECTALLQCIGSSFATNLKESAVLEQKVLECTQQQRVSTSENDSSSNSSSSGSELDETHHRTDHQDELEDVVPVKGKEAKQLNEVVIQRMKEALGNDETRFEQFKSHAMQFGTSQETAEAFYGFLMEQMTFEAIDSMIFDFARLLALDSCRKPLLQVHYHQIHTRRLKERRRRRQQRKQLQQQQREQQQPPQQLEPPSQQQQQQQRDVQHHQHDLQRSDSQVLTPMRNKSYSKLKPEESKSPPRALSSTSEEDSEDDHIDELPSTLRLNTVNHLMFVIHGIGQHIDFQEGEFKSWDGKSGLEGGNHEFRDLFRHVLETSFREIPSSVEILSIEWHEELHQATGVDAVFDLICPGGSSNIRQFNKETLMDVMYYMSARFGQLIVDSVTSQMNQKYRVFLEEHPGWDGQVSIFAHSLGSLISYDILTHDAGSISKNGVRFPGLEFKVENFFAVGSPVPVIILSRGDLNLDDGEFQPGIRMPACRRYFNIFHPIDPIAYRIEPLMRHELFDKPPVQLISANSVKGVSFIKLQEMWERITTPVHGSSFPRIDYVMKRRKRENMMEIAYAEASHSSYWMSEDVVMFVVMQICRPVSEKLHRYMNARHPLPRFMRDCAELTPHTRVQMATKALIRETCTGLSHDRVVLLHDDRLFILNRIEEVACRRRWRLPLDNCIKAVFGDDSFTLRLIAMDDTVDDHGEAMDASNSEPPGSNIIQGTNARRVAGMSTSLSALQLVEGIVIKAPTTPDRDDWLRVVNVMAGSNPPMTAAEKGDDDHHIINLHSEMSMDYFGAMKTGFLHERAPKGWYEGWHSRWFVLQPHQLSCFDNSPPLNVASQFPLRKCRIVYCEMSYLFRIVSRRGTSLEIRMHNSKTFQAWVAAFSQIPTVQMIYTKDVVDFSPSAVLLVGEDATRSSSIFSRARTRSNLSMDDSHSSMETHVQTKIEGFQLAMAPNGDQYASFVIQVMLRKEVPPSIKIVLRRHSQFHDLHRKLRKTFSTDQLPTLPHTRLFKKLDPSYLKQKAVHLHNYLNEICKGPGKTPRGRKLLDEFLELSIESMATESDSSMSSSQLVASSSWSQQPSESRSML